jgi:hypothetical protein
MQKIVAELRRRNVDLSGMRALEVFGYTGERLTRHYAPFVKSLEIWELPPGRGASRGLVRAGEKGGAPHVRLRRHRQPHHAGRALRPLPAHLQAALRELGAEVLVAPDANARVRRLHPDIFNAQHLAHRRAFYGTEHPERMSLDELALHYRELASENDFEVDWHFFRNRRLLPVATGYYDLLLKLRIA